MPSCVTHRTKNGDTLIEIMFAVGIFGLVSISTIQLMNDGLAKTQSTLEITMARQEIDTQAETLRFIHEAVVSDRYGDTEDSNPASYGFADLWKDITSRAYTYLANGDLPLLQEDPQFFTREIHNSDSCDHLFRTSNNSSFSIPSKSFILNPRALGQSNPKQTLFANDGHLYRIGLTATSPRLLYDTNGVLSDKGAGIDLSAAEGIWVTAIASEKGLTRDGAFEPDYFDFHIQTCWDTVSGDASAISSIVRLYNHEQVAFDNSTSTSPEEESVEVVVSEVNNEVLSYVFDNTGNTNLFASSPSFGWTVEEVNAGADAYGLSVRYGTLYPHTDKSMPENFVIYTASNTASVFRTLKCVGLGPGCAQMMLDGVSADFGPIKRSDASKEGTTYWVIAKVRHPAGTSKFYFTPINKLTNSDPSSFL